jgi:hypothetical protein
VEFTPTVRQVHTSADLPLMSRLDVTMEVAPAGAATRVTFTLEGTPSHGRAGAAFGRVMQPLVAKDNRRTLANLVGLVQRESKTPA